MPVTAPQPPAVPDLRRGRLRPPFDPPRLRSVEASGEKRGATWLELFFDLVFVVAIAQLAIALGDDASADGFLRFGLLFVPIWWAWTGYTMYADRFDTDDVGFRLLMLAGMLGVAGLAISIPEAFAGGSSIFAAAYVATRVVLIALYARAARHVPVARALCIVTLAVFVAGTALWLASLLVPAPVRFVFWASALVIEGVTPWLARRAMAGTPVHASHLPERFGLFTVIVLGESVVAVVIGVDAARWDPQSVAVGVLGFAIAASLWWVYFDFADDLDIGRSLQARNAYIYGHLPIAVGLTTVGVGIKKAILAAAEDTLPAAAGWALGGGVALFLLALSLIHGAASASVPGRVLTARLSTALFVLALAAVGTLIVPLVLAGLHGAALVSLVAFGVIDRARDPILRK